MCWCFDSFENVFTAKKKWEGDKWEVGEYQVNALMGSSGMINLRSVRHNKVFYNHEF